MTDWTTRELKLLLKRQDERVPHVRIAAELGRTLIAVRAQIRRLRICGAKVKRHRIPLHGLDLSGAHPVARDILKRAALEGFTYNTLVERTGYARGTIQAMVKNPTLRLAADVARTVGLRIEVRMIPEGED